MAYGARLESVLGESPRGFESPILRSGRHQLDPAASPNGLDSSGDKAQSVLNWSEDRAHGPGTNRSKTYGAAAPAA